MKTRMRRMAWVAAVLAGSVSYIPLAHAQAQDTAAQSQDSGEGDKEIVVTGSRFGGRMVTQSLAPIDLIGKDELSRGGRSEIQQMLKVSVPSFSTPRPTSSGVGDFTTPPTLRGLSTGQVLVLINGKRRHSGGDLNTSAGIGRGDVAYDFNAIPSLAIGNVEILRDGAAAQYGSDAIAGVINLALDKSTGVTGRVNTGITDRGDGEYVDVGAGFGLPIGDKGVIRATVQYQNHGTTDRGLADTRQQYFGRNTAGALVAPSAFYGSGTGLTASSGTLDTREATVNRRTSLLGDPSYKMVSVFLNSELALTEDVTLYAFGGISRLNGSTAYFFRRAGQDQTVRSLYPDGYIPYGQIQLRNLSAAVGLRGEDLAGFGWDISSVYGKGLTDTRVANSNNVSLGTASPREAYVGGTRFAQWTTNLDLSREIEVGDADPIKLAFGAEYREEKYDLIAGEPASYVNGGVTILDGPNAGRPAPVGWQPNPGIAPADATSVGRNSKAAYFELEKTFFGRLTLNGAMRYEDFSDFGDTTNYKLSGRFEISKALALRGSFSTGFRAPHLAQSFYSQSSTAFVSGAPVLSRVFPVDSPVAKLIGATPLKPEKSKNLSVGAVVTSGPFTLSLDGYQIELRDRIVISSNFQDTRITTLLAANGYPGIGIASYLTNAVDTTTRGADLTATYRFDLGSMGKLTALLAANYNKTEFDRVAGTPTALTALGISTPLVDLTQKVRISDSQPRSKVVFNLNWDTEKFAVGLTNTYYGDVSAVAFTTLTPAQIAALTPGYNVTLAPTDPAGANSQVIQTFDGKILTDLQLTYKITPTISITGGVNNVFDTYPTENLRSTVQSVAAGTNGSDNAGTLPYNAVSPFGFNGRSYFLSASVKF